MGREMVRDIERRKPNQDRRFTGFARSAAGVFSAHNPKVACQFADCVSDVLLTSVEPCSVSTLCRESSASSCLAADFRCGHLARFAVLLRQSKMVQILPPLRGRPLGHPGIPGVFSRPVTSWTLLKPF